MIIVDNLDNSNVKCYQRLQEITGKPESMQFFEMDIKDTSKMEEQVFSKF